MTSVTKAGRMMSFARVIFLAKRLTSLAQRVMSVTQKVASVARKITSSALRVMSISKCVPVGGVNEMLGTN